MSDPGIAELLEGLQSPDPLPAWRAFLDEYSPIQRSLSTNEALLEFVVGKQSVSALFGSCNPMG